MSDAASEWPERPGAEIDERAQRANGPSGRERRSMNDDEKAIIDLTIAYTWALDDRRFEDLREVFAADVMGDLAGVHCEGLDAILERIQRGLGKLDATQHVISNQQVRVRGHRYVPVLPGRPAHPPRHAGRRPLLHGRDLSDRLARRPEGWRIVHRTLEILWTEGNPAVVGR